MYTSLLYSGLEVVAEFLGFILCIAYLLFLFLYFRQYEEKCEAEQRNQLMKMQQAQSGKEIEAIRRSERAVSILRHDMRHFLLSVSAFIAKRRRISARSLMPPMQRREKNTAKTRSST